MSKEDEAPELASQQRPKFVPRRESPAVHKSYPSLKRGNQEMKVRLLQYSKSGPLLDIREWVTSPEFTNFTKKGIALDYDQARQLRDLLDIVIPDMEELP